MSIEKDLDQLVSNFSEAAYSQATKTAYNSDWKQFLLFCDKNGREPLPASPETISLYVADMSSDKSISTIVRAMTSISWAHKTSGFESPTRSTSVSTVIRGIKRTHGVSQNPKTPISYQDLCKMLKICGPTFIGLRDRSILSLGWAAALRRSEIVQLNVTDLAFEESGVIVNLRRSKTDQEGHGRLIAIPHGTDVCDPVKDLKNWIERKNEKIDPDMEIPLYPSIGPHGSGRWYYTVGNRLNDRMISLIVKKYAQYAGLPTEKYAAHSLRRGFATECGARNIPERVIAGHTGHRSISVLRAYIERGSIWAENPLRVIFGLSSTSIPS